MSKQRYILIFLLLGLTVLSGQIRLQNHSEIWLSGDSDTSEIVFQDRLSFDYEGSNGWRLGFDNDFLRRDYKTEDLYLKRYNSLNAYASYKLKSTSLRVALRNTLFGDATDMSLYPVIQPLMAYDKQMQNIAYLSVEQKLAPVEIRLNTMIKALDLRPWEYVMDMNTFEFVKQQKPDDRLWDLNAELIASVKLNENFKLQSAYMHQESDVDTDDRLVLRQSALGAEYLGRLPYDLDLAAAFLWQNRQGDIPSLERRNLYNSSLRLRMSISPQWNTSLSYSNHLCSDDKLSQILLISNYLRGTLKHSYTYDDAGSSYTILSYKYSPENKASALILDTELKVKGSLFLGAEILYSPDSFAQYRAKSSYRLGVYNSINLVYDYRDYKANPTRQQLGIGFDYYY